jgi:hypothetical protein
LQSGVRFVVAPFEFRACGLVNARRRVVYRKQLVTRPGETRTVTRQVTDARVVTRQVTVVATTTVVSTKKDTLPITITVTVP